MKYLSFLSIFLVTLIGLTSCTQNNKISPLPNPVPQTNSWALWNQDTPSENTWSKNKKEDSNSYWLMLKSGDSTNFLINHLKGKEDSIVFKNTDGKVLKVKISFLGKSWNLRLSQIVAPDGRMEGPFWVETNYQLTQNGEYTLKFNENQMAWDPWSWTAQIDISMSK